VNDLINKYVFWAPNECHGSRGRGRPRILYHQYIGKLINNDTPLTAKEMRKVATSGPPDARNGENLSTQGMKKICGRITVCSRLMMMMMMVIFLVLEKNVKFIFGELHSAKSRLYLDISYTVNDDD
jgi:hypothetical protein